MKSRADKVAESLGTRGARAAGIGMGGTAAKFVLQLGAQLVLLRLVAPSDYGIFAIAALCMSFANFLSDAGLSAALVQKDVVSTADIRTAFTLQTMLGLAISASIYLVAPVLAAFFAKPELNETLQILSAVCLVSAASSVSSRLLVRDLQYFSLQRASLAAYFIGYGCIGIPMAALGFGYRALAYAWLSQAAINAAMVFAARPHSVRPGLFKANVLAMTGFGYKAIITNIANWWNSSVDKLMVGRFFGPSETGLYAVAYNLIYTPLMQVLSNLQSVIFSAASRLSADAQAYKRGVIGTLTLASLLFFPGFVALSASSEAFVAIVLGKQWLSSSPILSLLAPSFAFAAVQGLLTPFLWGKGVVEREMGIQLLVAAIAVSLLLLIYHRGVLAVAGGALAIAFIRFVLVLGVVAKTFGLTPVDLLRGMVPALCVSILTFGAGVGMVRLCDALGLGAAVALLGAALSTAAIMVISMRFFGGTLRPIIAPLLGPRMSHKLVRSIFGSN